MEQLTSMEQLTQKKEEYLKRVQFELENFHPEDRIPDSLLCLFTQEKMRDPVISIEGKVYDASSIYQWLQSHDHDPLRKSLKQSDLHPFDELKPYIEQHHHMVSVYQDQKEMLLNHARNAVNHSSTQVFVCSLSGKTIQRAVITSSGEVFDKEAYEKKASSKPFKEFPEFNQYLNFYRFKLNQTKANISEIKPEQPTLSLLSSLYGFLRRQTPSDATSKSSPTISP